MDKNPDKHQGNEEEPKLPVGPFFGRDFVGWSIRNRTGADFYAPDGWESSDLERADRSVEQLAAISSRQILMSIFRSADAISDKDFSEYLVAAHTHRQDIVNACKGWLVADMYSLKWDKDEAVWDKLAGEYEKRIERFLWYGIKEEEMQKE